MPKQGIDLNFGELFNACLERLPSDPTLTTEFAPGYVYYNTTDNVFRGRTATGWITLGWNGFTVIGTKTGLFVASIQTSFDIPAGIDHADYIPVMLEVFGSDDADYSGSGSIAVLQSAQLLSGLVAFPAQDLTLRLQATLPVSRNLTIPSEFIMGSDLFVALGANNMSAILYGLKI